MINTKAFYRLTQERNKLEEELELYNIMITELREKAKKLKKGTDERKELMNKANDIKNGELYREIKTKIETMNFCINVAFYY